MSDFKVEVVRVGKFARHPDADTLCITSVYGKGGYPVIFKEGAFKTDDLAVYVPVDAVMPKDNPDFAFLDPNYRIKAKRLRGIYSQGMLLPMSTLDNQWVRNMEVAEPDPKLTPFSRLWKEGDNVQAYLRIEKYEREKHLWTSGEGMPRPSWLPEYTDLEPWKYKGNKYVLEDGEEIIVTEKLHGTNSAYAMNHDGLWVCSRHEAKKEGANVYWQIAKQLDIASRLPVGYVLFGEIFGEKVQDLSYGLKGKIDFRAFDIFDTKAGRYLDYDAFQARCDIAGIKTAPVLYRGPWSESVLELAEGRTTLNGGACVREGFVVRPVRERWDERVKGGRVILKAVGEGYHLRKGG
jgi:RNA ligase (TIGR02306 family)